jgi:hypothetical protein
MCYNNSKKNNHFCSILFSKENIKKYMLETQYIIKVVHKKIKHNSSHILDIRKKKMYVCVCLL